MPGYSGILLILLTQVTPTSCGLLPTRSAAVLDEPSIRYGLDGNGLLNESEEQLAAMPRPTPIEPERELVEVVIQMRVPDPTLMRTEQPPFEQRDHLFGVKYFCRRVDARARILKDGAGGDRGLATTPRTLPPPGPQGPRLGASTAGALKAGGPAKACEVGGAGFLGIEPSLELGQRPRVIVHGREHYILGFATDEICGRPGRAVDTVWARWQRLAERVGRTTCRDAATDAD